jgi:ribosomal protein L12E/L44/L45/RPP1/RPP2
MKYIFRYSLLTNYTNKQQQITPEQLNEALKMAKFSLAGKNLEELIQQANQCIDLLLKNSEKKDL